MSLSRDLSSHDSDLGLRIFSGSDLITIWEVLVPSRTKIAAIAGETADVLCSITARVETRNNVLDITRSVDTPVEDKYRRAGSEKAKW